MDSRHLVFVIHNLQGGGAEKVFTGLVQHFSGICKVSVITFETGGVYENELQQHSGIQLKCISNSEGHISLYKKLRKFFKNENPDKVISFLEYPNIMVSWALKGLNIPHISSERTNYIDFFGNSLTDKLKKFLLRGVFQRAEKVIAVSSAIRESLINDFNADPAKVIVIRNGINFSELKLKSAQTISGNYQPGRNTILAAGRFTKEKNYPLLIKAFHQVLQTHPDYELCILGEGNLKPDIENLARELKLGDKLILPGFERNPAPYMMFSGCFVLSSDLEGMPNALIEALYLNGHVVSTDCKTGPSEIITHGMDGILTPVGEVMALSQALIQMMEDETFRDQVYLKSRESIQRFEQSAIWHQWEQVCCTP